MKHNLSESYLRSLTVDKIVRRLNKMQLTEAGIKRIMARAKNGMIVISAHRSAIASGNPDNDLQAEYEEWCDKEHFNRNSAVSKQSWLNGRNKLASESLRLAIKESPFMYSSIYDCHKDSPIYSSIYDYLMEADYLVPTFIVYSLGRSRTAPLPVIQFDELYNYAVKLCKKYKQDSVYVQPPNQAPFYVDGNGDKISDDSMNFEGMLCSLTTSFVNKVMRSQYGELFLDV